MKFELSTGGAVFVPDNTDARKEKIDSVSKQMAAAFAKAEVCVPAVAWYCMDALLWCFRITGHKDIAATLAQEFESLPWSPDTRSDEQADADAKATQEIVDSVLGLRKAWDNNGSDQYDAGPIVIALVVFSNAIHNLIGHLFGQEAAKRFSEQIKTASEKTVEKVVAAIPPAKGGLN